MPEKILRTEQIQIERKQFELTVRENDKGKLLRITETAGGKRDMVIIPWSGIDDFRAALENLVEGNGD